ncbi:MAG: hypothetical protein ACHQ4H_01030 [Ktedonobacterales bacterium]
MLFTTIRIERPEGTPQLSGVAVQIEQATVDDLARAELDGDRVYDVFWLYTTQGVPAVPLQRRDVLFDEQNLDPETSQFAKYRIAGMVETFASDHQEALIERVVGG